MCVLIFFLPFQYRTLKDQEEMSSLRQLLLMIRLWGGSHPNCRPVFTKTADSFDVVAKAFALVTKLRENPADDSINGMKHVVIAFKCFEIFHLFHQTTASACPARL